jgi:uncharacterized LabA/DUF88 family protein
MIERSRRVVLLIDYDNLQICASRDTPGRDLQLTPVVQLAQHYGTVILARAYAEWNLSTERLAVYKAGIEPAFAPVLRTESDRSGKSLADTVMVAEGMDMLWTLSPEVVVLATSDKDLIPLVRVAKQRGAFVVVLGSDFTAIPLREMADEHVTYKQLITDSQGRYVTEAGPARQAAALPEPARRRPTRERNGRERAMVTPTAATPPAAAPPPPARIEREQQLPAPAQAQGPAPSTPAVEPVAPLAVGMSADGDAQGLGRRRRRRGSRRRSERIGGPGEGSPSSEGGLDADGSYADGPESEEPEELSAAVEDTSAQIAGVPEPGGATIEAPSREPSVAHAQVAAAAPAAPRNRRRTARRPAAEVAAVDAATAPIAAEEPVAPPPVSGSGADILWASEPAAADGKPAPADAEPGPPADGEPIAEEAAVTPRPRSRRVASAARGRTRPAR